MDSNAEILQKCLEKLGLEDALEFILPESKQPGSLRDSIESQRSETILKQSPDSLTDNKEQSKSSEEKGTKDDQNDQLKQFPTVSNEDALLIRLLELVSEYEELANGAFRSELIDGFSDLSRATFNSTRKFGPEAFDMRPYEACKTVEVTKGGTFQLLDQLHKQSSSKATKTKKEGARSRKSHKNEVSSVEDVKMLKLDKPGPNTTMSESEGKTTALSSERSTSELFETKPKLRDPINQFGGLVPYQLRTAQTHFSGALTHSLKLLNLRCQIKELISKAHNTE